MTASGIISNVQDTWRTMIATCTAFRTWDGNDWSVAQAKEHVHHDKLPDPESGADEYSVAELGLYLPYCVAWTNPNGGFELDGDAVGEGIEYLPSGVLGTDFYRLIDGDAGEGDETFRNMMGALLTSGDDENPGLLELAGRPGYLCLVRLQVFGPIVTEPRENPAMGQAHTMRIVTHWS